MRKANKPPSEWLRLLCRDWAIENEHTVQATDLQFLGYKSYLKGRLSSQLLCRLSIPEMAQMENDTSSSVQVPVPVPVSNTTSTNNNRNIDFWTILGIQDDFDKSYIISQVERFCAFYSIRAVIVDDDIMEQQQEQKQQQHHHQHQQQHHHQQQQEQHHHQQQQEQQQEQQEHHHQEQHQQPMVDSPDTDTASLLMHHHTDTGHVNVQNMYHHHLNSGFVNTDQHTAKHRHRVEANVRKAVDRAAREASREEKRQKKLKSRQNREQIIREQKEAALARAAELVRSNRVPIEITRGGAAAAQAADAAVAMMGVVKPDDNSIDSRTKKKQRSDIIVSTASDLDRIVTHAKNLWTKYNAIAKEHNQKVSWSTVAKELGIHVKVREKYARMHARALQRGFDFKICGKKCYPYSYCFLKEW